MSWVPVLAVASFCALSLAPAVAQAEECSPGVKLLSQNQTASPAEQDRLLRHYKSSEKRRIIGDIKQRWDALSKEYLEKYHANVIWAEYRDASGKEWAKIGAERDRLNKQNYDAYLAASKQIDAKYRAANAKGDAKELARLSGRSEAIYADYSKEYERIRSGYWENGATMEADLKAKYQERVTFEHNRYTNALAALRAERDAEVARIDAMTYGDVPTSYASLNSSADCSLVAGTRGAATASAANGGKSISSSSQCGGHGSPPPGFTCREWARYMDSVIQQRQFSAARRRSAFIDAATDVGGEASNLPLGPTSTLLASIQAQDERLRGNHARAASISFTAGFAEWTDRPVSALGCAATGLGGPALAAVGCVPAGIGAAYAKNKIVGAGSHLFFRTFLSDSDTVTDLSDFSILSYE